MKKRQQLVYIYFIILPFIDLITSLITRFTDFPLSFGMVVKGITMVFIVLYVLFWSRSKYKNKSVIYLGMMIVFGILYLLFKQDMWSMENIVNEVTYAFRYMYFPIMLVGLFNLFDDLNIDNKLLKKILLINCITYTVLLLVPFITGTGFDSYRYSSMFGQNGWFYAANETGVITVILSSSILYFMDNEKKWKVLFTIPIIISIIIIGTKTSYLGIILVILMICLTFFLTTKKDKLLLPIVLLVILITCCNFSPTIDNLEGTIDDVNNNKTELGHIEGDDDNQNYRYNSISDLIPNKNVAKVVTIALNGRDKFFLKNLSVYAEANFSDKLFGIGWSDRESINYVLKKKLIEIDFLDIIIHYGIIGFIIYFLPLCYFIFNKLFNIKKLGAYGVFYFMLLLLVIGISSFAGHIFASPSVSIYIVLLCVIINNHLNENKKLNNDEITIMALHLGYGGIEQYISSLCKMVGDEFKIKLIVTYKISDKPAFSFNDNIKITYLIDGSPNKEEFKKAVKNKNFVGIIKEGFKSAKILYLKKSRNIKAIKKIDSKYIITTRDFHNLLVGLYADKRIIKIATEHNYHNDNMKYVNKVVSSVKNFDYFILVSENLRKYYEDKVKPVKCIFIPNVIDNLPNRGSSLEENTIINIGRLSEEKGQSDLLDVISRVREKVKDVKLVLIGDGALREKLEKKVKDKKLEENVMFTGFIGKESMEKYLLKSKLFVMTSFTESFGLVLIEAMSYKIPCIAYDSSDGARELLKDNVGILVENRNENEMVSNIINMLNDNSLLEEYSKKAYAKAQEYVSEKVRNRWIELLKESTNEKK